MENAVAVGALKAFVDRYERLATEAAQIAESQRELLGEVKGQGFDVAIFKDVIKARRQDTAARAERGAIFNLYMDAAK